MNLEFASFSNVGPRKANEDRLLSPTGSCLDAVLVAIADGIGGAKGGAEAASIAIEAASAVGPDPGHLEDIFRAAARTIADLGRADPEKIKAGTTLSVATIINGRVDVAHVGDTRIYHLRGRGLNALTQDQTEIAELVRRGVFTESQARRYPRRNVLLSALTASREYEIYRSYANIEPGDRLLLLSDGVHGRVKRGAILNLSLKNTSVSGWLNDIEQRVEAAKPSDNYTALGIQIKSI
ncbi:PP2C family protein-serine/threonine phosphatase [Sphingomonas oligophenolica]|uniref:PPM-type phosphatase domain-containing protein n=1 Tax=Sphingomonas oligophenolica TaxID=301154 RepID=A0A502CFN3_9SPHN|nr:protein phosphatase 2C domain-containing protein [Sphingomonas oligophenolica]TPG11967.1 hypothetical protein EAH84_10780 [Sphingomonas oligophenolica]